MTTPANAVAAAARPVFLIKSRRVISKRFESLMIVLRSEFVVPWGDSVGTTLYLNSVGQAKIFGVRRLVAAFFFHPASTRQKLDVQTSSAKSKAATSRRTPKYRWNATSQNATLCECKRAIPNLTQGG